MSFAWPKFLSAFAVCVWMLNAGCSEMMPAKRSETSEKTKSDGTSHDCSSKRSPKLRLAEDASTTRSNVNAGMLELGTEIVIELKNDLVAAALI
jgi:hypothetical protein